MSQDLKSAILRCDDLLSRQYGVDKERVFAKRENYRQQLAEQSRIEMEILMRAEQLVQASLPRYEQVFAQSEERRCRTCQKLIKDGFWCHGCKAEDQQL